MSEFFKQLIAQLDAVWRRLSLPQKIITSSLIVFTVLGMAGLLIWSHKSVTKDNGYKTLYSNLDIEEAADITDALQKGGYKYKLENEGKTILVEGKYLYQIRMAMAKEGLPRKGGIGYELFDKNTIGTTDYVLKINSRRALEGEIKRTIEELDEVKSARVHIVIPEPTIFLENQKEAKASVVIKCKSGKELTKEQIRGISYLVSSSVEGLKPENISIVDYAGKLLSDPSGMDENTLLSSRNMELQQNMEKYLENKVNQLLTNILGPSKAYVKISCDLDFDRVEKSLEKYNPESKVVRSEERIEENKKNAPDGDNNKERTLTNYEIDKTIEHIIGEIGNIKRLTISVAIDGRYEKGKDGKVNFITRSPEELHNIEEIVKNAVGYDLARGDLITVSNIKFDNEMFTKEMEEINKEEKFEFWKSIAKYFLIFIAGLVFILFIRSLAKTVAEAMNPPVPTLEQLGIEEPVIEEAPEDLKKSSEILERVEILTREEPVNIALIIKEWLNEMPGNKK